MRTHLFLLVITVAGLILPVVSSCAGLQFLEDPAEGDFDVTGSLTVTNPASCSATLVFNYQPDKSHYLLTIKPGVAKIALVRGGKVLPLGPQPALTLKKGATPFTLQRRAWRIALIWGDSVILRAYDATLRDGTVGTQASGAKWDEPRIQPVGDIIAEDDFVREEGAESIWEPILGKWESRTLRDDQQAGREEADKSANAFSYFGTGQPRAITVAGNWFWDRYLLETSMKAAGQGAAGLVFYYQNDKNYLLLRWSSLADTGPSGAKLQLVAMRDGQEQVLAERAGGYEPDQFYKLRVQVCDGLIQCLVDDEPRLQAYTNLFGQGQIGLYVEGRNGVFFDDVVCAEWEQVRDSFSQACAGKWRGDANWLVKDGVMSYRGAGRGLAVTGQQWERYGCTLQVQPGAKSGAGLAFAYNGPKSYCVLRYAPPTASAVPYRGKVQLVRVSETGGQVLDEAALPAGAGKCNLRVSVEDGLLSGVLNDTVRLQALAKGVSGGAIALYAEGPAQFDNLQLGLLAARKGSHVTKEFSITDRHPEMAAWASTQAPWVPPAEGQDDWWSKGDYFGDTTVTFTVPAVGSKTGSARALLGSEPRATSSGVTLTVAATEKSKKLSLTLTVADKPVKTAEIEIEGDANISFSRESRLFVVRVNDQPVMALAR